MPSSLSVDAAAVEDALLRGEWTQALNDSRSMLAARPLRQEDASAMTTDEERVLSVYLQAVFELDLDDEVETAATIARAFAPLPSEIAIQWGKFLVAMNRRPMAAQALRGLLGSFAVDGGDPFSPEQYAKAAEVLALQFDGDRGFCVLQQLLRRIQAAHLAAQEASKVKGAVETSTTNQKSPDRSTGAVANDREVNGVSYQSVSGGHTRTPNSGAGLEDDSSCYVMIGGTAIALALAAAGALRYREKIQECVSGAIPAISKGLADAKYALFEA
uniref:Uncharacterized protein n=1 Tax=Phytophthora ramorum TaxID=164328 RepID=H3H7B7_PHYRM